MCSSMLRPRKLWAKEEGSKEREGREPAGALLLASALWQVRRAWRIEKHCAPLGLDRREVAASQLGAWYHILVGWRMKNLGIGKQYRSRSPRTVLFSNFKIILSIGREVGKQWGIEMTDVMEAGGRGIVRSYWHNPFLKWHGWNRAQQWEYLWFNMKSTRSVCLRRERKGRGRWHEDDTGVSQKCKLLLDSRSSLAPPTSGYSFSFTIH